MGMGVYMLVPTIPVVICRVVPNRAIGGDFGRWACGRRLNVHDAWRRGTWGPRVTVEEAIQLG
jgi:hypothetical protein